MNQRDGRHKTDVVVVGGGSAGLAAALAARLQGLQVVVLEAARPSIDKVCGEGLMPEALAALRRLGVHLTPEHGTPFVGIRFVDGVRSVDDRFPSGIGMEIRRPLLHTEGLIGLLMNTVLLRTHLGGNPTFREVLRHVRDTTLAAYVHQDRPFEDLLRAVVTHELYTSRHIRDVLRARAQAVLDVLRQDQSASGGGPRTPPPPQAVAGTSGRATRARDKPIAPAAGKGVLLVAWRRPVCHNGTDLWRILGRHRRPGQRMQRRSREYCHASSSCGAPL
jgi:hypothetical protein